MLRKILLMATLLPVMTGCAPRLRYPATLPGLAFNTGPAPVPSCPPGMLPSSSQGVSPACAPIVPEKLEPTYPQAEERTFKVDEVSDEVQEVLSLATGLLGAHRIEIEGRRFPMDCSGLVRAVYSPLGIDLFDESGPGMSGSEMIYHYMEAHGELHRRKRPQPGDVAFFHDTYDRNGNGRRDDKFTHVALVETTHEDGTIILIHTLNSGIKRTRMNLYHPDVKYDPETGALMNDELRRTRSGEDLAGELFVAFGRLDFDNS